MHVVLAVIWYSHLRKPLTLSKTPSFGLAGIPRTWKFMKWRFKMVTNPDPLGAILYFSDPGPDPRSDVVFLKYNMIKIFVRKSSELNLKKYLIFPLCFYFPKNFRIWIKVTDPDFGKWNWDKDSYFHINWQGSATNVIRVEAKLNWRVTAEAEHIGESG